AEANANALRLLQAVTDAALAHLASDETLRDLLDRIPRLLDVDGAAVLLPQEEGPGMTVWASSGDGMPAAGTLLPLGRGPAARAFAECRSVAVEQLDPGEPAHAAWVRVGLASLAVVPLVADGRALGVLCVGTRQRPSIDPDELRLFQLMAD